MNEVKVGIKKLVKEAVIPSYAKPGDAGMDLTAVMFEYDKKHDYFVYHTGLAFEIPEGYVGLIFPRSSNRKTNFYLTNHVGVIDSGYRGEVMLTFKSRTSIDTKCDIIGLKAKMEDKNFDDIVDNEEFTNFAEVAAPYSIGDRIGQIIIIPYPQVVFEEKEELSQTERGEGGHGSTGK